jgi:hypothetical protein
MNGFAIVVAFLMFERSFLKDTISVIHPKLISLTYQSLDLVLSF